MNPESLIMFIAISFCVIFQITTHDRTNFHTSQTPVNSVFLTQKYMFFYVFASYMIIKLYQNYGLQYKIVRKIGIIRTIKKAVLTPLPPDSLRISFCIIPPICLKLEKYIKKCLKWYELIIKHHQQLYRELELE